MDEVFTTESKRSLVTNNGFSFFNDSDIVKIYKIGTSPMNDYGRSGPSEGNWSRYGAIDDLDATTEEMQLKRDRSFTFCIDTLDCLDTVRQLEAAKGLARQTREVVIPEVDSYVYNAMAEKAGTKPEAIALTKDNIYEQILTASETLDDAKVPETGRVLLVNPETYRIMKLNKEIVMETEVGADLRKKGVIGILDGANVIKAPSVLLPENFGFMLLHPCATVAPIKLQSFLVHNNPPGLNGDLVEGRIVYDAFVLENKALAIYYQSVTA